MGAIILFDGICNLCSGAVQFIIKRDPKAYFKFASLQSDYGQQKLAEAGEQPNQMHSLLLIEGEEFYFKSTAILRICRHLSGGWKFLNFLLALPRPFRDWLYDLIARHRYRWFGKKEECMIPGPSIKKRFL